MYQRIRVLLGASVTAALLLAGGHYAASAAETRSSSTGEWVAVSAGERVNGLVRPDTLARESSTEMTRRSTPIRPQALAADAELFDLTVKTLDRTGAPAAEMDVPSLAVVNLDDSEVFYWGATGVIPLPAGRYAVIGTIETPRAGRESSYSFITNPELLLDRDTTVTLDARIGRPVSLSTDNPAARGGSYDVFTYTRVSDCSCTQATFMDFDPRFAEVYAATVPGVRSDSFAFGQALRASEAPLELVATGARPFEVPVSWLPGSPVPEQKAELTAVYAGGATGEELARLDVKGKLVLVEVPAGTSYEELFARIAAVQAKGGRMVLMNVVDAPLAVTAAGGPVLPTMEGKGPTVRRFFDQVRAAESTVDFVSRSSTALRYELAYGMTGAITGPLVHRPSTAELAAVPTTYHEGGPAATTYAFAQTSFFGSTLGAIWSFPSRTPQQRVEYFTPGTWSLESGPPVPGIAALKDTRSFTVGPNPPLAWNKAVSAPSFTGTTTTREGERPWAWRDGGALDVILPMFADSAGRPRVPSAGTGDTGSISLYRNGEPVGTVDTPNAAHFEVVPADAYYRLSATATRTADWWPLSTTVSADWTFRSGPADDGKPLPLLTVRFDPALDPTNKAKGGRAFTFPAYAPGANALTVDVSYDDGATWQPAAVAAGKGSFAVTVRHSGKGFASLRARAAGPNGNTVEMTVLRAYRIGG
jgi:hypothetical protein